jgi:hypothetical protein
MRRGMFDSMKNHDAYTKSSKRWYISLQQVDCFWFDIVVNPPGGTGTPDPIKAGMRQMKEHVEKTLEKRFIYMYGARKKLRFDLKKPLSKKLISGQLQVNLLVGRDGARKSFDCDLSPLGITDIAHAKIQVTDKWICVEPSRSHGYVFSVHDFVQHCAGDTGDPTHVHYVGLTKNPHTRPLDRSHRGYSDMIYGEGTDDYDFFLYVCLFKVMTKAVNNPYGIRFMVANSMIDEVNVEKEGALIEGAFIAYFDSKYQEEKGAGERAKLESELRRVRKEYNIESILLDFELEAPSPFYRLCSHTRPPADRHVFECKLIDDKLQLSAYPADYDAVSALS